MALSLDRRQGAGPKDVCRTQVAGRGTGTRDGCGRLAEVQRKELPMDDKTPKPCQRRGASRILVTLLAFLTTICVGLIGSVPAQAAPPEPSALSGRVTGTLQDGTGRVAGLFNV